MLAAGCSGGAERAASSTSATASTEASLTSPPPTPPAPNSTAPTTAAPTTAPTEPTASSAPPAPSAPLPATPGGKALRLDRGDPARRAVALTFDAGADRGYAGEILDLLRAEGVKASFGMTGRWAEQNPELMRRIVAEGHHVINHTYDHSSFTGRSTSKPALSRLERIEQLTRTEQAVARITPVELKPWFRPPYGDLDGEADGDIAAAGYRYNVLWSTDSLGWKKLTGAQVAERTVKGATPGGIILMHVGQQAKGDYDSLPTLLAAIRSRGLTPGSVLDVV